MSERVLVSVLCTAYSYTIDLKKEINRIRKNILLS